MKKKWLAIGIILLFVGTSITQTTAQNAEKQSSSRGNWLYVGGSGPGNYTRIQDAIDNASDGDTVFVFDDSSPYYENILVDKRLTIQGENRNSTIVITDNSSVAVNITSSRVNISEFTFISKNNLNIFLLSDYCVISNNTFENISLRSSRNHIEIAYNILRYRCQDFSIAIWLYSEDYSIVKGNDIMGCTYAINLLDTSNSSVSSNFIHDCFGGVSVDAGCNNRIMDNTIVNVDESGIECSSPLTIITGNSVINATQVGIELWGVILIKMYRNKMQNCFIGFLLYTSLFNRIIENDFLNNTNDTLVYLAYRTRWRGNYWGHALYRPKMIICYNIIGGIMPYSPSWEIPYYNFDWFPSLKPHNIGGN